MVDFSAFYEMECIQKMDLDHLERYKTILEFYGPKLPERIELNGSAFTPHDMNHCLDIYKIISNVLFNRKTVYTEQCGLTKRELYILNLAVLFHDFGMSNRLGVSRETHSKESADYVQAEYDNSRSCFRSESNLTPNEIKALKSIIKAHSNIKDGTIIKENNGIYSKELCKKYRDYYGKPIRSLFLAGVLRIADELDITNERLGSGFIEEQIEEGKAKLKKYERDGNTKEIEKWNGFIESEKHWKKLHLFEVVTLNTKESSIDLIVDDDYVEILIDEGSTEKSISNDITEVFSKIKKEFDEIKKKAFSGADEKIYISAEKISVISENETLQKEIDNDISILSLPVKQNKLGEDSAQNRIIETDKSDTAPIVIDYELEKMLSEEVKERQLLQFGHFLLTDKYCARDWLNIREIVETRDISKKIVSSIVKHINSENVEKTIILGLDIVGALLASRIAFSLQMPMSYIISVKNADYNSAQDIDFDIKEDEKVILITDSIVTFKTLDDTLNKYGLENKIKSIYTIFYRKSQIESENRKKYINTTYSLNNSFPIEVVKKEHCIYQSNNCFAKNRH